MALRSFETDISPICYAGDLGIQNLWEAAGGLQIRLCISSYRVYAFMRAAEARVPWTEWLEPEKCVVSVLEAGNLELRCQQGCALQAASRRDLFRPPSCLPVAP